MLMLEKTKQNKTVVQSNVVLSLVDVLLSSSLLLSAVRSIRLVFRSASIGLLRRPAPAASCLMIQRVESYGVDVCVLCALAALYP